MFYLSPIVTVPQNIFKSTITLNALIKYQNTLRFISNTDFIFINVDLIYLGTDNIL